jgi:glycogen synthase
LKIYHDGSVKIRPDHLFLAFTSSEHLLAPRFANYSSLYQLVIYFATIFCRIIQVDICHCHDWQTGLVPVYARTRYRDRPGWQRLPVVYAVHNAGYQGIFPAYDFPLTGLDWGLLSPKALEFYGQINFMKGGLVFADLVSTVSARYREEILTPEYGCGLEGVFQERAAELYGIPEGVDYSRWNTVHNKGGNYKELHIKSPFDQGGFRGIWKPSHGRNFWQTL